MVVGAVLFTRIGADTALWVIGLYMPVFGLGLGMVMQPVVLAVQNAVPPQDIGVATVVRRRSSGRSAARWARRCSCRCCSRR